MLVCRILAEILQDLPSFPLRINCSCTYMKSIHNMGYFLREGNDNKLKFYSIFICPETKINNLPFNLFTYTTVFIFPFPS